MAAVKRRDEPAEEAPRPEPAPAVGPDKVEIGPWEQEPPAPGPVGPDKVEVDGG